MRKIQIGKDNTNCFFVPTVGMGTWAIGGGSWWGENDDTTSICAIQTAIENRIVWVDTAPVYGYGHSEEVVGKALKDIRKNVILSTKCGLRWDKKIGFYHKSNDGYDIYRDLSAKGIRQGVEESLKRLNTDYIDILYTHWQSEGENAVPIQETMEELMKMKQEGVIRGIGASNITISHLEEYLKYGELDVIQEKYSILDRKLEKELIPFCEEHNISIQAYSPLEQGLLTGKITMETSLRKEDVRYQKFWWKLENRKRVLDMLERWKDLTQKYQCSVGNLVIAWTVTRSEKLHVLCGARTPQQALENAKACEIQLESYDILRMEQDINDFTQETEKSLL